MKSLNLIVILGFLVITSPVFTQNSLSLKEVMSYSFPSGLTAAPSGETIAWVENKEGVRNIFFYDGSEKRQLTDYKEDDGQDIGSLTFSPDGKILYFVRGGAPNRSGEIPNPTSHPEKATREIYQLTIADKSRKSISSGYSPTISPDGKTLAFLNRGQVWKWDTNNPDSKAEQFFNIRGGAGSLAWSPEGNRLAYVSRRGDHAFVGVYELKDESIVYLNPSVDNDMSPVWSNDGSKIAFIRVPGMRNRLPFRPVREAHPWSIWIANPETGSAQKIWTAKEGVGSAFHGISASDQLFFMADNSLIFPWEGDGFVNLYNIKIDGSGIKMVSAGKSEVQFASLSNDRKSLVFSGNGNDIDRQHVWKYEAGSAKGTQLTKGDGIEFTPVVAGGKVFSLASGPTTPAFPAKIENGKVVSLRKETVYPNKQLTEPEQIVFSSTDGIEVHGQLFLPPKMKKGQKYPAVLFFHGGSRRQMLLGFHHRGYYHNAYAFNQYLASQGYIVMSVNYRSGIGYGMEFREALNYGANGASEFQDVMAAGLYMRNRKDVDPEKIGLWGGSYGGYLTAMGLAKASNLFAAGVDIHGVHDWNVVIKNFVPGYNAESRQEFARLALASSPMPYVNDWKSPVLLIHGDDDRNVPFSETVDIAEELRNNNVDFEQLIFPDEVHGFLLHSNWMKAYEASFDFFERKLRN